MRSRHSLPQEGAIDWNGITSVQATPKDKVKFKLTEESECDACHDSEVASAQNELCLAGIEDHQDIGCLDCHTKDKALEGAHRKLSADSKEADSLKRHRGDRSDLLERRLPQL